MESEERLRRGAPGARWAWPAAALAGSCHLGPAVAVTALAAALAVCAGHSGSACALITAAVLSGQLSVGWCNDAFDARRDAAVGRRKPVAVGAVPRGVVWTAAFLALAVCAVLSLVCGLLAGPVHLTGVAAAWAYNLRLKATMWSWLPYAVGFASLPAFVTLSTPDGAWPAWWVVTAGALLGVGAHLADTLPDIPGDLATGVRGLPHRMGLTGTRWALPVPLVAATAVLSLGPPGPPGGAEVAALGGASAAAVTGMALARRGGRAPFAAAVVVAVMDVVLLLARGGGMV
ncbi:UbiA family prenyltransferase [Streptomyces sp. ISL-11]|uniref:UbiA family prenyltransferase n=1 Tax=Streptomyces sp. ISL-11 TaxID=2819174 RepID=UPI001BEBC894|nr:UbiA family prenyltransferase [Streptomyces sp. ISL-11]MBT2385085.1 UbiA family prenyltransferase [Streptomyces sp. ISL-11]